MSNVKTILNQRLLNSIKTLEKDRDSAKKRLLECQLEYMSRIYILEEEAAESAREISSYVEKIDSLKAEISKADSEVKRLKILLLDRRG